MEEDYDAECLTLAEHFLADQVGHSETDVISLARHIQVAVEEWFARREY